MPVIIVFDFVMVLPIFIEIFLGIPNSPYPNFTYAMQDTATNYIFLTFVVLAQFAFLFEIRRIKRKKYKIFGGKASETINNFIASKYKNPIKLACYLVFVIVIIGIIMSPEPLYYTRINSVYLSISADLEAYNNKVMKNLVNLLFISVFMLKLLDDKDRARDFVIRIIFTLVIVFVNQKRTLLMIIVGGCLVIDIVKEKKIKNIIWKYSVLIGATAIYFYVYMIITDKISYNSDWYYEVHEYIFRTMHMRFSIYAALNPSKVHILDYPGQSILFSLFYFVPRTIWVTKPWPYIEYYIAGVMGYRDLHNIGWHMPASYYPEFVSNFGLLGIPFSVMFTIFTTRFFDNRKQLCKMMGIALISLLEIYYYDNMLKIVAAIVLFLWLKEKIKYRNGKFIWVKGGKIR